MKQLQLFMMVWNNYYSKKYDQCDCVYTDGGLKILITRRDEVSFLDMGMVNRVTDLCRSLDLWYDLFPVQVTMKYKPQIIISC